MVSFLIVAKVGFIQTNGGHGITYPTCLVDEGKALEKYMSHLTEYRTSYLLYNHLLLMCLGLVDDWTVMSPG